VLAVPTAAFIVAAIAALVVPLAFVAIVVAAAIARRRGAVLDSTTLHGISFAGGLAIGSLFLIGADDLTVGIWFLGLAVVLAGNEWRRGRRASAGWLVAGTALPWTLLWGALLVVTARGVVLSASPADAIRAFAAGALPLAAGLVFAGQFSGEAAGTEEAGFAPRRSFGVIARAIRAPSQIGPFPLPELAAVIAWAAVGLAVAFVPVHSPLVQFVVAAVVGSALASEAYLRAMAPSSRRAMEAFSWLGERDLAELRHFTGESVPTTARAARAWLARHPMVADESAALRSLRIQVLLMAGWVNEARQTATDRPAPTTAEDRFAQAADRQLVAWWTADPDAKGALASLEAEARAVTPADSDAHVQAEIGLATAQVRQLAVDAQAASVGDRPLDVIAPLVAARERLGERADGLLRRVLWRRMFGLFLAFSVLFELIGLVLGFVPPL
jgi:hypothetical protein